MTMSSFHHPLALWARRAGYASLFPYQTGGMVPPPLRRGSTLQGVKEDLELAEDPATDPETLVKLYYKQKDASVAWNKTIRPAILSNPNTPTVFLKDRVAVGGAMEADAVGQNPSRLVGRLTLDPDWNDIDLSVAQQAESPDVLRELSQHPDPQVRKWVGLKDAPEDVLIALATDPSEEVQELMAEHAEYLPMGAKRLLVASRFSKVRELFANQATDEDSFKAILESGDNNLLSILAFERDDVPKHIQKQAEKLYPRS